MEVVQYVAQWLNALTWRLLMIGCSFHFDSEKQKQNKKRSQSHKSVMNYYWKRVFWIDRYLTELECAETLQELNWLQLKPSQRFDFKWRENEKAEWWHVHKEILTHWCEGIQKYITLNVTSHKHKHLQVTLHRFVSVKIITVWKKLKNQF